MNWASRQARVVWVHWQADEGSCASNFANITFAKLTRLVRQVFDYYIEKKMKGLDKEITWHKIWKFVDLRDIALKTWRPKLCELLPQTLRIQHLSILPSLSFILNTVFIKNGKVWFKNSHVVVLACLKKGLEGCSQYSASGRNIRGHFKTPLFLWSSLSLCI